MKKKKENFLKNILLLLLQLLFAGSLFAQDSIKTQTIEPEKKDTIEHKVIGYYIAPQVGISFISERNGEPYVVKVIGGEMGIILHKKFVAGIILNYEAYSENGATNYWGLSETRIYEWVQYTKLKSGGIFVDFLILNYDSPIRISFPIAFKLAQFTQKPSYTPNDTISSHTPLPVTQKSNLFSLIEPSINLDFNFSKHIVPSISAGFRVASTNKLNFNYPFVKLTLKLGKI